MVDDLRAQRQGADAREAPADEAEVECGDCQACGRSPSDSPSSRLLEDDRPAERQGEVHGNRSGNEGKRSRLPR